MADPLWHVKRPPGRALKILSSIYAILFFVAAIFMIPLLVEQHWLWYLCGAAVGCVLAALLCHSVWQGTSCSVNEAGVCTFGMHNKANLEFDLRAVEAFKMVRQGPLNGVGVQIAIEAIAMLHHKGISFSKMHSYQKHLGVSLVLECLTEEDLNTLQELKETLQNTKQTPDEPNQGA